MNDHTPGPWKIHTEGPVVGVLTHSNVDHLATCYGFRKQANARLMAAAPELLAALRLFMAQYDSPGREARPEIAAARAAIAKATTPTA